MSHPSSCTDSNCTLTYRQHLLTISYSSSALPSRLYNRTPGMPDELASQTNIREKRWERDHAAFRRLVKQGYLPPQVDGSRFRERTAQNSYDINSRQVTIDPKDPT